MAQNDDLFHAIGGGHADAAALADLMGDTLDEHIGGLGFPGVDHMDIVVLLYAAGAARHTVGIKHKDEHALLKALIVAEDVHQPVAGRFQALFGECVQLVPCKDDVVAVHQQVFGLDLPLLGVEIGAFPLLGGAERRQRVPLDGPIGLFKDLQQLSILFQSSTVGGHPAGAGLHRFLGLCSLAPAAVYMHVAAHLLPGHHKSGPVGAEHRIRRVVEVVFRLIARGLDDLCCIVAGTVAVQRQGQVSPAPGVAHHLHGVAAHGGGRCGAGEQGGIPVGSGLGWVKAAAHVLDIVHGAAHVVRGQLQPEGIPRLQQLGLVDLVCHHQALPDGAVGRLPEVAALGVLEVGAARNEGDFHIGQGCPDEHAQMLLFLKMRQHQPLPVLVQHLFPAVGSELHPAAPGQRLQLKVDFRIVAQGLVVAHAFHGFGDGLLIQDAAGAEADLQPVPLGQQAFQHLQLNLAHQLDMDLAQGLVPDHMELGLLFFQPMELSQRGVHVCALGQQHLIAQNRLQHRQVAVSFRPQTLTRAGFGQAGNGAHLAGADALRQRKLCAGVKPQLVGLFGPWLPVDLSGELGFHLERAAGHPQPGQAVPLLILAHLEHLGPEGFQRGGRAGIAVKALHQRIHTLQFQG